MQVPVKVGEQTPAFEHAVAGQGRLSISSGEIDESRIKLQAGKQKETSMMRSCLLLDSGCFGDLQRNLRSVT